MHTGAQPRRIQCSTLLKFKLEISRYGVLLVMCMRALKSVRVFARAKFQIFILRIRGINWL